MALLLLCLRAKALTHMLYAGGRGGVASARGKGDWGRNIPPHLIDIWIIDATHAMFVPAPRNHLATVKQRNGVLRADSEQRDRSVDVQRPLRRRLKPC